MITKPRSTGSISLGATRIDIGQGEVNWVVLADPDDNEFCVLTPNSETNDREESIRLVFHEGKTEAAG